MAQIGRVIVYVAKLRKRKSQSPTNEKTGGNKL